MDGPLSYIFWVGRRRTYLVGFKTRGGEEREREDEKEGQVIKETPMSCGEYAGWAFSYNTDGVIFNTCFFFLLLLLLSFFFSGGL